MLEDKLFEDFKQAMKNKDQLRSSILSFLRSKLKNLAIDKRKDKLEDAEVVDILRKEAKRHEESIEQFKKGARADLVEKETKELEIIKTYLPASLSEEEIKQAVDNVLKAHPGATMKEMGIIMKEVISALSGRADGSQVSGIVKLALSKPS